MKNHIPSRNGLGHQFAKSNGGECIEQQPIPPLLRYKQPPQSDRNIVVVAGEYVQCGQTLIESEANGAASLHAGSSGTVTARHYNEDGSSIIEITTDGLDTRGQVQPVGNGFMSMPAFQLQQLFHSNGIVGLGGACFPVAHKLSALKSQAATVLLINAVECDPAIQCDRAIILTQTDTLARAIDIAAHACQAKKIIVAIKDNDPDVRHSMQCALQLTLSSNAELRQVPDRYPVGFERHLFAIVTENNIKNRPTHMGLISFNIATCFAMARLVDNGEPLVSRVTTVHEPRADITRNAQVRLGTPMKQLLRGERSLQSIAYSGMISEDTQFDLTTSVSPASNCVILNPPIALLSPCIRCGLCANVCPESLQPQQLLRYARQQQNEQLTKHQMNHCIECGLCDSVCPSNINLTRIFQRTKQTILRQNQQILAAERAKTRYETREKRLEKQRQENLEKLARKQKDLTQNRKLAASGADPRKQLLESALKRRTKKNTTHQGSAPNDSH